MALDVTIKAAPVDVDFILNKLEGTVKEVAKFIGHIPKEGSGITIGNGLDLGYQNKESLMKMGLNESLIKKLSPYLGKVSDKNNIEPLRKEAQGLTISNTEADAINKGVIKNFTDKTRNQYNSFFNYKSKVTGQLMPEKKGLVDYQSDFDFDIDMLNCLN